MTLSPNRRAVLPLAALLTLSCAGTAIAQNASTLRSTTRNTTQMFQQQLRNAIVPRLEIRRNAIGSVEGMTVDAGWQRLATVLQDGSVRVWNLDSGALEASLPRMAGGGAQRALVASAARRAVLIDTAGNASVAGLPALDAVRPLQGVRPLAGAPAAVSADGRTLFLAEADGSVGVWDLDRAARQQSLPGLGGPASALALSPDGSLLAAASANGSVAAWRVAGGTASPAGQWSAGGSVTALTLAGDGTVLAALGGRIAAFGADGSARGNWQAGGTVTALSWSQALGGVVSGGEDGAVKVWRVPDGRAISTLVERGPRVTSVLVAPAGNRVLVSGASGAVQVLEAADGRELARLIATRDGWIVIDPAGRFDGMESTFQDVVWNANGTPLAVENFSTSSYAPGLAAALLRPQPAPAAAVTAATVPVDLPVDRGIFLPPQVSVAVDAGAGAGAQPDQQVEVRVEAVDQGNGEFGGIRLFHNGKRIPASARRSQEEQGSGAGKRWIETYTATLVGGANEFRAVALGAGRIESDPATTRVDVKVPKPSPTLRITSVGINRYDIPGTRPLSQSVNDAKSVVEMFRERSKGSYAAVEARTILEGEAKRATLLDGFRRFSESKKNDVVVLYLSGHGKVAGDEWHFMPVETRSLTDDRHVREVGIPASQLRDLLVSVPAQQIVLLIDACQSGAAIDRFEDFAQRRLLRGLSRETGVFVLAATKADQLAPEYEALGHGLFTYTMLNAFHVNKQKRMNADLTPTDAQVTVNELKSYVEKNVPILAAYIEQKLAQQGQQRGTLVDQAPVTPTGVAVGRDFTLVGR